MPESLFHHIIIVGVCAQIKSVSYFLKNKQTKKPHPLHFQSIPKNDLFDYDRDWIRLNNMVAL